MQGKETRSFSIVDEDDDFQFDEEIVVNNARDIPSPVKTRSVTTNVINPKLQDKEINMDSEDDDEINAQKQFENIANLQKIEQSSKKFIYQGVSSSPGPSSRVMKHMDFQNDDDTSSDSESRDSDVEKTKHTIAGEYDPSEYENLQVTEEIKELFQYISKYIPQNLNLDFKFKPFIPDFIPAVGDIDAFLKVMPPDLTITGEPYNGKETQLGLTVLDEPAANQSDPAVLHLQLRASSVNVSHSTNIVVKKVENVEKNLKIVDKWIKDITDLHKSKSSPFVKYSDLMPELDDLMEVWPEAMENMLKTQGFPNYKLRGSITEYIDIVCSIFDIPIYKNRIQSLHLFFSLYASIKNSQLYKASSYEEIENNKNDTDQLVLD